MTLSEIHNYPDSMTPDAPIKHARLLVADDEESIRFILATMMRNEGYQVDLAEDGQQVVQMVREGEYDLLIMDIKMPNMDGLEALREVKRIRPSMTVVMITAFGSNEVALEAIRAGAYDYFNKPFEMNELKVVVRRALEKQSLLGQVTALEQRLKKRASFDRIIGISKAMKQVFGMLEKVIGNDVTVLVTGESGTGKELVAQAVHYQSNRKSKPFVTVNCAAIPESLLESELFGHERGAFTGAVAMKMGKFEAANGGTIFLDEIGEMPLSLQSKMLRVLQEREIVRIGSNKPIKIDVRIVTATNKNLLQCVENKEFREDLYYRVNVMPIYLPALRRRIDDIPLLIEHFIQSFNPQLNRNIDGITPKTLRCLMNYPWPGNVRELENAIQRAMILTNTNLIEHTALQPNMQAAMNMQPAAQDQGDDEESEALLTMYDDYDGTGNAPVLPNEHALLTDFSQPMHAKLDALTEILEKRIIMAALKEKEGHRQSTADLLGISRKSLHNKMVKYQLFEGDEDPTDL